MPTLVAFIDLPQAMPEIKVDHYTRRMKVAERAAKLAKRVAALIAEAEKIEFEAHDGRKREHEAEGHYSGGWTGLEYDGANAANQLSVTANALKKAALDAGFKGSV